MKIEDILKQIERPELYKKGTATMWTDEYISRQLLKIHLNTEIDLASRKMTEIKKTVDWIIEKAGLQQMNILDLGCGPGLYAELFAQKGHKVTGVDFSKVSIEYAQSEAIRKKLDIKYIHANYLELDLDEAAFDLVILIYTDFGVLLCNEREQLLQFIFRVLKRGGIFIFDVMNDENIKMRQNSKDWEISKNGFWKNEPYIAFSESYLYEVEKLMLFQHVIVDEKENIDVYRFWTQFFSNSDIEKELKIHHFSDLKFFNDVLPEKDMWSGNNVTFCRAVKK